MIEKLRYASIEDIQCGLLFLRFAFLRVCKHTGSFAAVIRSEIGWVNGKDARKSDVGKPIHACPPRSITLVALLFDSLCLVH